MHIQKNRLCFLGTNIFKYREAGNEMTAVEKQRDDIFRPYLWTQHFTNTLVKKKIQFLNEGSMEDKRGVNSDKSGK